MFSEATSAPSSQEVRVPADVPELHYQFPGIEVGTAEYETGPTGATVIVFRKPVKAAVDVRGGAPGTINTDALRLAYEEPFVDAITLAGGSSYGLSVATGVANALKESTAHGGQWTNIKTVPGAIIFDLGGRRFNTITPDEALGRAALAAARPDRVPLGAHGGGRFAMQGHYFEDLQHSGQGAAFRQLGPTKVLVVTIVNALGSIVNRSGRVLRCAHPQAGHCELITERLAAHLSKLAAPAPAAPHRTEHAGPTANTTITVVVTNQAIPYSALQRLAVQVHNSMARAIQPFGTEDDGDTLFAATTGEITNPGLSNSDLGALASEVAWDAILASAPDLPTLAPKAPAQSNLDDAQAVAGEYRFAADVLGVIRAHDSELEFKMTGEDSDYLPADTWVRLDPVGHDEFELATGRGDRLRLERDRKGQIRRLTLNPGPWPISAIRIM